jgi:hypothetical protein
MNKIINLCKILDSKQLYKLSDTVFNKFASKQSIMDKKIFYIGTTEWFNSEGNSRKSRHFSASC